MLTISTARSFINAQRRLSAHRALIPVPLHPTLSWLFARLLSSSGPRVPAAAAVKFAVWERLTKAPWSKRDVRDVEAGTKGTSGSWGYKDGMREGGVWIRMSDSAPMNMGHTTTTRTLCTTGRTAGTRGY
ncbi:hypothetical protein B0H15DRAFT_954733 [Mycena belliarum]|uniref:Uncharacterized protein n=1 Tax=Mycena belliarum TaxID=1033014 RepID=A0AAD6TVV6_9AGAR|nr:hypothetical protein B0H15DRAFT_954733 [Mycena belliae]